MEADSTPLGKVSRVWGIIKKTFSIICAVIIFLAGGVQVYKFFKYREIGEGPIPLKEASALLEQAQSFLSAKKYTQARDVYYKVLEKKDAAAKPEAIVNLRYLEKKGVEIKKDVPLKEVSLQKLPGAEKMLQQLQQQNITVTGKGVATSGTKGAHAKLVAEQAAIVDAYRKLAVAVYGMPINARMKMEQYICQSETQSNLQATIRGAKILATRHLPDGLAEVDMLLPGAMIASCFQPKANGAGKK